jgi:hypothetical protein
MTARLHSVGGTEGRGVFVPALPGHRIEHIIEHERLADKLDEQSEEHRWEAARLISEELADGTSQHELAARISKSQPHVFYMKRCWELRDNSSYQSFDQLYGSPEVRGPQPKDQAPKQKKNPVPKRTSKGLKVSDLLPEAVKALARGQSQTEFARARNIPDNSMVLAKAWAVAEDRRSADRPVAPAKLGSISGKSAAKRLREISQERKKSGAQAFLDVRNFMYRLNKVTQVLASWQPGDLGLATDDEYGDVTLDRALMLSSDLLDLDQWLGRVTASVDRYLTQYDRVEQIRKIDALIANPATSPEEAVNYRRIRDRKQRNLDAEIMSAAAGGGESNEQDH